MPADANVSLVASINRSSTPLSQCSLKGVQPIPTMATLSLMPCELMRRPCSLVVPEGLGLPEVVLDAVGSVQSAEGQLDPLADGHVGGVAVGQLDRQTAP